ncbi:hypothetical protein SLS53_006324 [Cytospora paraplurivora]|uniref:Uncharacterized protein n=1 Tax=Cytospora paraplurivora TaxID=2898453 RepID=A0AAN9U3E4_9PEZI
MVEAQNSDEELLAMLQPLTTPEEFVYEQTLAPYADTSDEDDGGPIPQPAPAAPMAPMAPLAPLAPMAPLAPIAPMEPNGLESSSTSNTNGRKVEVVDSQDEIEYEIPAKPKTRSPVKRPLRTHSKSTPAHKADVESGYESTAELLKSLASSKGRGRSNSKLEDSDDNEMADESPVKALRKRAKVPVDATVELESEPDSIPKELNFEVLIAPLPPHKAQEYTPIPPGDEIYRVLDVIKTGVPGEAWLSVEFEDGRIDQVAFDQLSSYPNGRQALASYRRPKTMAYDPDYESFSFSGNLRKRKAVKDPDFEVNADADEDEAMLDPSEDLDEDEDDDGPMLPGKRRKLQKVQNSLSGLSYRTRRSDRHRSLQPDYVEVGQQSGDESDRRAKRKRNLRNLSSTRLYDDDVDELQHEDGNGVFRVTSDIVPEKKSRRRGGSTRNLRGRGRPHAIGYQEGDDIAFELPRRSQRDHKALGTMTEIGLDEELYTVEEEKLPTAPKASGAKEAFDTREHAVTKVSPKQFVLQCRHCIGVRRKKDNRAPNLGVCQVCRADGPACEAFAPKRTATQEQKLREENGGEDPVNPVEPHLLDNADNVLFRCVTCHCAYHFDHLPPIQGNKRIGDSIRAKRLAQYSTEWKCKDCIDMAGNKIDVLVAWRPVDRDVYITGQTTLDMEEDAKEYLVKWAGRSYAHCEWKTGPWVYGVTNAVMRKAFPKRKDGANLLPKFDKKEAIPEEYLLADVVLDVRYKGSFAFESKKLDLEKTWMIDQALIKFEGLDYTEAVWDEPPNYDSGDHWKAFISAYSEFLNGKHFKSEPIQDIKERLKKFRELKFQEDIEFEDGTNGAPEQPDALTGTLMKYQIQGLNWILHSFWEERSVVLADEMGLGKTIQVISLMTAISLQGPRCWPWLVVVPNSTCPNWRREIKQWAPDFRVVCYHGGREAQRLAYKHELFPNGAKDMKAHVVVMSYDSAQDENTKSLFRNVKWIGLVVDEGQRLKNDENLLYGALQAMKVPWRLLLTGTPLQNNKRELFNLLQFIDPSRNAARLDEQYAELTKDNINELHDMIRPYFLRRTKAQVLKFLPPMAQIILPVSMSVVQEKLCKSIMQKNPELIRAIFAKDKLKSNERSSLNNILIQLRKCLGHPFLYSGAVEDKNVDSETMHRNLVEASSKLMLLEQMLPKLQERGHRVLIFSQFLGMIDIIEDFLSGIGFKYHRLDGSISSLERQKRIDSFNEPGSEYFAFLLSTRAGGVGINLATADTVIILDPDFNPHQDLQALSRAHRIGQKKKVLCFQLMTKGSVEEKIMQIGRKKMALDHALIESMDKNEDEDAGEDLESILKHGADALFGDNEKEQIRYDAAAVEKLLDRSQMASTQAVDDEKPTKSQFAYARVWENKTGDLADDIQVEENPELDIGVWDQILKQREEEAKRLAELNKEVLGRGGRRRQAVKYTAQGNYGLEDQQNADGEERLDSDIDEDFIRSGDSDSDNSQDGKVGSGASSHGQGKAKKGTARGRKTPHKKQTPNKNTPQPTPSKRATPRRTQPTRKARTPQKPATPRKRPTPRSAESKSQSKSQGKGSAAAQERQPPRNPRKAEQTSQASLISTPTKGKPKTKGKGTIQASEDKQDTSSQSPSPQVPDTPSTSTQIPGEDQGYHNCSTPGLTGKGSLTDIIPNSFPEPFHTPSPFSKAEVTPGTTPNTTDTAPSTEQAHRDELELVHCPDLRTEIHIRLALDGVKALSAGDPEKIRQNRAILQNFLKAKKNGRPVENKNPPNQAAQQPQQPQQPLQQQARLVAPQQQFEKESSGSDDDESGSEESSDYESDEEASGSDSVSEEVEGTGN